MQFSASVHLDISAIDRLRVALRQAEQLECAVGFPKGGKKGTGNPHYKNGASILQVAMYNNFGFGVPRRAFMELATKGMTPRFNELLKKELPKLISGEAKMDKFLKVAGEIGVDEIRKAITDGMWQPNSPKTIEAKKSDRPLIDSGDMRKNVEYVVRKVGEED